MANSREDSAEDGVVDPPAVIETAPESMGWRRARDRRTVDLPLPLGPTSAVTRPEAIES